MMPVSAYRRRAAPQIHMRISRRGVAAEHGPVVHERDARAAPRGGEGGTNPRHPAADDAEINLVCYPVEGTGSC